MCRITSITFIRQTNNNGACTYTKIIERIRMHMHSCKRPHVHMSCVHCFTLRVLAYICVKSHLFWANSRRSISTGPQPDPPVVDRYTALPSRLSPHRTSDTQTDKRTSTRGERLPVPVQAPSRAADPLLWPGLSKPPSDFQSRLLHLVPCQTEG